MQAKLSFSFAVKLTLRLVFVSMTISLCTLYDFAGHIGLSIPSISSCNNRQVNIWVKVKICMQIARHPCRQAVWHYFVFQPRTIHFRAVSMRHRFLSLLAHACQSINHIFLALNLRFEISMFRQDACPGITALCFRYVLHEHALTSRPWKSFSLQHIA